MTRFANSLIGFVSLLLGFNVVLLACSNQSAAEPPQIIEGRSLCSECHMSIDDLRFAAAYRLPDGTEGLFDDIGDMVKQQLEDNKLHTASSWVFDFLTMKPIPVNDAWFIQCEHITTPMGSGIAAYSLLENAQKAATAHEVRVVNWTDLVNQQTTGLSGLTKNQHHH